MPALSADLFRRRVAAIAAISGTLAAKAATTTIPIVFAIGGDPIVPGLVTSLSRPGGNVTGVSFYSAPVVTKRLDLARELVGKATTIGMLINPDNPPSVPEGEEVKAAAAAAANDLPAQPKGVRVIHRDEQASGAYFTSRRSMLCFDG